MKKLYHKATVHPPPPTISGHLSFLPAAILTLTAALSPEDKEILAYLISCSSNNIIKNTSQKNTNSFCSTSTPKKTNNNYNNDPHPPLFTCGCFWCYMSYWVRWDASPNRHVIHEIIDAFEDWLLMQGKSRNNHNSKKYRRDKRRKGFISSSGELERSKLRSTDKLGESNSVEENSSGGGGGCCDEEKGSVRRFVSFIGERIWGVLG